MRRLVRELCKEKLSWNSFTLLEIVRGFSLTQASWSPVRSEEPESRWRYSSQFSLLRTYSAITAPRTPACINKTEYISIAESCLESIHLRACESFQLTIQAQSAVGQAVKSLGADWPGLCSDEWYHTKSAMHLTASVLGKNQTNNNHIWTLSLMNGFVVNKSNGTLFKSKIKYLLNLKTMKFSTTSSSLSGWMSSMSLWASFCSFSHCWEKYCFTTRQKK